MTNEANQYKNDLDVKIREVFARAEAQQRKDERGDDFTPEHLFDYEDYTDEEISRYYAKKKQGYLHSEYPTTMKEKEERDLQMTKDTMYQKRGFIPANRSQEALGYEPNSEGEGEKCSWCAVVWMLIIVSLLILIFY